MTLSVLIACEGAPKPALLAGESAPGVDSPSADSDPAVAESCDGVDNDADGLIDEGHHDADGDGLADCIDDLCVVSGSASERTEQRPTCGQGAPPEEPWSVEKVWTASVPATRNFVRFGPIVDVDGDGVSDIVLSHYDGTLVLSGVDGQSLWQMPLFAGWDDPATTRSNPIVAADIDADGDLELVGVSPTNSALAVELDGTPIWSSAEQIGAQSLQGLYVELQVADLLGDGRAEAFTHHGVVDLVTGDYQGSLDTVKEATYIDVVAADLDQDGVQEVLAWQQIWSGTESAWVGPDIKQDGVREWIQPIVAQLDSDPDGEIVWVLQDGLQLRELDGSLIDAIEVGQYETHGLGCAGDFTGDGRMEFVTSGLAALRVWAPSGYVLYTHEYPRGQNGGDLECTAFDFDLDGADELVLFTDSAVEIVSVRLESVLWSDSWYGGGSQARIVDLDGDGSAELIVLNKFQNTTPSLRVYGHTHKQWPPAGRIWPMSPWNGTQLFADGRVPRTQDPAWIDHKLYRGTPEFVLTGADLLPEVVDHCVASCERDGQVRLSVRLVNLGPYELDEGGHVAVYGLDTHGRRQLVQVLSWTGWIDNRTQLDTQEVVVTTAQAERGLVFVAGDEGTGAWAEDDCDPDNNEVAWSLSDCEGVR